jgi:protein-L-isoaspartate(D-aspartate) O-methyltransferase
MSRAASPSDLVAAARAAGLADARVLAAISATPRAGFVPADDVTAAYRDEPIPIGHPAGEHAAFAVGPDDRGPAPAKR